MKAIVTTAGRPTEHTIQLAKNAGMKLHLPYIDRQKRTVTQLQKQYQSDVLVATKSRWEYYGVHSNEPFFFHPSSAMFRIKRLARGEADPLVDACKLVEGDTFLDCTLGYASDSLVAAYMVGVEGSIVGCEASKIQAFILDEAFHGDRTDHQEYLSLMKKIQVISSDAVSFLKTQKDSSFDVVYLDPMFEETIQESENLNPLRHVGRNDPLTEEWVTEATRVAKKRVVLKAHFQSAWFKDFQFQQIVRRNTKFHFGYIDCTEKAAYSS
ncbi:MAG: class I SAM-dependent methyltransferase [Paenisporosarcina sp.]